jgi:8-oxo-dGTP diphosphatase
MNSDNAGGAELPQLIPVLAAVISRGDSYLVCRRPVQKRHGGLWEFPGGKLEAGETWLDAAQRELAEELGLTVESVSEPVFAVHDAGSVFVITFVPVIAAGEPQPLEHAELRWARLAELPGLDFAPSDRQFVDWLLG